MEIREIMEEPHALRPDDRVIDFISLMENKRVHEAPVVDEEGKLVGFVHYKILVRKNVQDPTLTKIGSIMEHVHAFNESASVEEVAKFLFENGLRAVPVVDVTGNLVGIVSVIDVLKVLKREKIFSEKTGEEIMSPAEVIHQNEDIGKARAIMREKNISRLPVVDDEDKLVGEVTVLDLLKAIQPKERVSWYSMAAEELKTMDIPVSVVMNKFPITAEELTKVKDIIEKLIEGRRRGCIIVKGDEPVGVVTTRDILELWLSSKTEKGVYVQYSGLEEEDNEVMDVVDRMVSDTVRKVHSIYPVEYMHIHIKRYRKTGERKLFSVRCRVMTTEGVFIARGQGWDLRDAIGEAMDHLEKIVKKYKEKEETENRLKTP